MASLIRFRILHMLVLLGLISGSLWLMTQAGMTKAEIEVLEVSGLSFMGPDGTHDNWGASLGKVRFRFIRPVEYGDHFVNLFVNTSKVFEKDDLVDRRIVFRYRSKNVVWMKPENLTHVAIENLGFDSNDIEEIITEFVPSDYREQTDDES